MFYPIYLNLIPVSSLYLHFTVCNSPSPGCTSLYRGEGSQRGRGCCWPIRQTRPLWRVTSPSIRNWLWKWLPCWLRSDLPPSVYLIEEDKSSKGVTSSFPFPSAVLSLFSNKVVKAFNVVIRCCFLKKIIK